jgi:predicted amidohydrolase YtcJ
MLDRTDVHCTWVSDRVLALLPSDIEDVPGGEIIREPGMGVFCDNAMEMIYRLLPKPNAEKKRRNIRAAMKSLNSVGLVGVHDAGQFPDTIALWEQWAGIVEDWTLRVYTMAECPDRNTVCLDKVRKIEGDWLTVRSIKLFAGELLDTLL